MLKGVFVVVVMFFCDGGEVLDEDVFVLYFGYLVECW